MNLFQAAILGIVQGLTEILPISSSGHLILVPAFLGWPVHSLSFDAALHLGTALAILVFFAKDGMALFVQRRWRTIGAIALASLPVGLAGLLGRDLIERNFRGPGLVAGALVAGAVLMLAVERWYRRRGEGRKNLTFGDTLVIGISQTLALIPGVSRSGITILTGMGKGIAREDAARFSFLISLPIVFAASLWELLAVYREGSLASEGGAFAIGIMVSFGVGLAAIRFLFGILKRYSLIPFAVYRIALGLLLLAIR